MALGVTRRVRQARRADKWWRSVYHTQLAMTLDPKPLTGWMGCATKDALLDGPRTEQENEHE